MVSESVEVVDDEKMEDKEEETEINLSDIPWDKWSEQGESKFLLAFSRLVKSKKSDQDLEDAVCGCSKALHLLIMQCVTGNLTTDEVHSVIDKILFWSLEIPSIIVDILSIIDMDSITLEGESKKKLIALSKSLSKIIPVKLFKERYEMESLTDLDILPSKHFPSKFIKVKTRLYYKQNKFNLLREENEGFSKLTICLFNRRILKDGGVNLEESKNLVLSLCGWFNLDPARALDIILDIFESNLVCYEIFIPLIKEFVKTSEMLFEVIMFRYLLYSQEGTPSTFHSIVVHLINNDMINFYDIYDQLEPSDENIYAEIEKKFSTPIPKTLSLTKKTNEEETVEQDFEVNQKFGLMEMILVSGRWDLFTSKLNETNREYFIEQQPIAEAVCRFLHYLINPVYNEFSYLGPKANLTEKIDTFKYSNIKPISTLKEFITVILPMLELLGPSIQHSPSLIFKLSRLLISIKSKLNQLKEEDLGDFDLVILKIIDRSFLPALSHLESNCCVAEIVWDLLKLYPIAVRYCAYSNWKEYSSKCPTVLKRKAQTNYIIRNCLKKVSKENVKPMGRIMGKISHHGPIELFEYVMYQIQMYDSLILPIVESLKYLNTMAYDVLSYVMVEAFRNDPNKRSKHDGNNPSPWFLNTAVFCASILKKYSLDITGLLKYILEELLNKNYVEILVFKEILQKMTGIEITDEMTDDQIDALGGGECLRGEAAYFVPLRSMKRSANRLKDALIHEDLFATTSIIIAQLKCNIVYEEQDFHLKFLGKLYDECHDTMLQYGTFISGYSSEELNFEFPPLETLVLDYRLTHECAFFLCRQFLIHKAKLKAITNVDKKTDSQGNGNIDSDEVQDVSNKEESYSKDDSCGKNTDGAVNNIDCDTLSCISSEDLEQVLEEESFGTADEADAHNISEDDSMNEGKKTTTINEIYNMEVCEKARDNFEWDEEDSKTWTQHHQGDSTCNQILEYKDEMDNTDYMLDEDDMITGANVFDIPKIFNIPPDSGSCLIEHLEVVDDTRNDKNTQDENSIIVLDEDISEERNSENDNMKDKVDDAMDTSENLDEDSKDKNLAKANNSSKLVNILLDWVIPSVLKIQDNTSFISEEISPYASAVFWTLTLYDIHAPVDLYDKEIGKLKTALSNQEHSKESSSKIKKEVEKLNMIIESLTFEKKKHVKHVNSVLKKLDETKNEWFAPQTHKNAKNELINVLLHSCVLPRVLFSAMDAVYCAKFILTLHQLHTENFSTVLCYDRLLCDIKNLVAMCSENEASRFGRFLCAVLKDVMRFHSSQDIYNAECANTPGFITKFRSTSEHIDPSDKVHYENYRHLCHKWHYKITKALLCLLDSKEYILIRNTIIVLKKILPHFPVIMKLAQCIEKKIGKIKQEEKDVRQDLHTLATSYWGHLKSKMSTMVDESQFHLIDTPENNKESEKEIKEKTKKEDKKESVSEKQEDKNDAEEEEFPLSKSDPESPKRSSRNDESKEDSTARACEKRSSRSTSSKASKRSHSESNKKLDNNRTSSEDSNKLRAKKPHKSRSKSIEIEVSKKEVVKKTKVKRDYVSPEAKKSRKKEKDKKVVSKRKEYDNSDTSPERKHKAPPKTKKS